MESIDLVPAPKPVKAFPVIHLNSTQQGLTEATHAMELGADGVYLIDHQHGSPDPLLEAFETVVQDLPDAFVGVNLLCAGTGLDAFRILAQAVRERTISRYPDAVWADDARPERLELQRLREADKALALITYLGGTSFKYTSAYSDDPSAAAAQATQMAPFVDVVCTSGPGTGHPTTPQRVAAMKQAIGEQELAVASGVDVDNVGMLRSHVDQVLVATSIETSPGSGIIDHGSLAALLAAARG